MSDLLLASPAAVTPGPTGAPAALASPEADDGPEPSVLVVEDDATLRYVFTLALSRAGMAVRAVGCVQDALDAFAEAPAQCVIVDRGLPGVSGLDLLRRIRATPGSEEVRVIVVSGLETPDQRVEGLDAGADDYVVKPVGATELVARVRAQLRTGTALRRRGSAAEEAMSGAAWAAGRLQDGAFSPVFQPIVGLETGATVGFEGLTRFADGTRPDHGFARATAAGIGVELELAAIDQAIARAANLPSGAFLSLNVGAATILDTDRLGRALASAHRPLVLELTEHDAVLDYDAVRTAISSLSAVARLAIDDVGNGYATLAHVLELRPDILKLDRAWVHDLPSDRARRSLLQALCRFAGETGAELLAEGIETPDELAAVRELGIGLGQGYLLGRPEAAGRFASV